MKFPMVDCYTYIREAYGVPAYTGVRVRIGGRDGVLVNKRSDLHYLHVRFDGASSSVPAHPTSDVEYLVVGAEDTP